MDNTASSFAKGAVNGVAIDIEKWMRDYAEHTPIEKKSRGSDDQFTLTLYKYFFGRSGGDPIRLPYAEVKVTGWNNGTTDVQMWTIPADRAYYDKEQEDEGRRSDLAQMSAALLRRFPYADVQAAQPDAADTTPAETSAGDGPQDEQEQDAIQLPDPSEMKAVWKKYSPIFALQVAKDLPRAYEEYRGGRTTTRQWGASLIEEVTGYDRPRVSTLLNTLKKIGWTSLNNVPLDG